MYDRRFICKHCGVSYRPKRSDQKFCSTSHRAANHQFVKRQFLLNKKDTNLGDQNGNASVDKPSIFSKSLKKQIALTFAPLLVDHTVQKAFGVHNHDLRKKLDEVIMLLKELERKNTKKEFKPILRCLG